MRSAKTRATGEEGHFTICIQIIVLVVIGCCLCFLTIGSLGSKLLGEVGDVGAAIGNVNQSYTLTGIVVGHPNDPTHPTDVTTWAGSSFADTQDYCDQSATCGVRGCLAPTPEAP